MNRIEFIRQLEKLLQNISPAEREEALQYYNDYFDDAGAENEQDVIEALGNPAKVAETIKKGLDGSGYNESGSMEGTYRRAVASDRAVIEYGQQEQDESGSGQAGSSQIESNQTNSNNTSQAYSTGSNGFGTGNSGYGTGNNGTGNSGYGTGNNGYGTGNSGYGTGNSGYGTGSSSYDSGSGTYSTGSNGSRAIALRKKDSRSTGTIVIIAILCIVGMPVIIGLFGGAITTVFGILAGWFGLILGFGAGAIVLMILTIALLITGISAFTISPAAGLGLIGGALICGGLGLLFTVLTVVMAGIATPAIFRFLAKICRYIFRRKKKGGNNE